jgi:diphthamide biosynthesis protein 4
LINGQDEPERYTYSCRCSGEFVITLKDLEEGIEVVGCGGCGEWVRVDYEVVEEGDDGGAGDG